MKSIDLTNVFEKYKGLWVALDKNHNVVSVNKDIKKVYNEAKKKGYKVPSLFKVPEENIPFFGVY